MCTKGLRLWAGSPSPRGLSDLAGIGQLPKSSISDALNHPEVLPELALPHAFVEACGGESHRTHWLDAWRRLAADNPGCERRMRNEPNL